MRLLLTGLALLLCQGASAQDRPGHTGRFLGWSPDSSEFAYSISHHRRARWRQQMREPKVRYFLKRVSPSGVAQPRRLRASVPERVRQLGYKTRGLELERQKLSPLVQTFFVGHGRTLRLELQVGKRSLSYSYWLDDATRSGEPRRLMSGYLKEVWTDFEARAFLSPDGKWVALVLSMATPYRSAARAEGVLVWDGQ